MECFSKTFILVSCKETLEGLYFQEYYWFKGTQWSENGKTIWKSLRSDNTVQKSHFDSVFNFF